jgi:hypothetical protein
MWSVQLRDRVSRGVPFRAVSGNASCGAWATLVAQADALLAKEAERAAELRRRRDEIDQAFNVKAREAAETAERERLARRQALVDEILRAEENRLAAVERAESSLKACIAAIHSALKAGEIANAGTKKLSHGTWSSWSEQDLVGRLPQRFAQTMIHGLLNGRGAFGLHCKFVPPPNMPSRSSKGDPSWRDLEEHKMAPIVGNVLAEIDR